MTAPANGLHARALAAAPGAIDASLDAGWTARVQPAADGVVRVLFARRGRQAGTGAGAEGGDLGGGSVGGDGDDREVVVPQSWTVLAPGEADAPLAGRPRLAPPPGAPRFVRVSAAPSAAAAPGGGAGAAPAAVEADAPGGLRVRVQAAPFSISWYQITPDHQPPALASQGNADDGAEDAAGHPATDAEGAAGRDAAAAAVEGGAGVRLIAADRSSRPYSFGCHGGPGSLCHAMARHTGESVGGLTIPNPSDPIRPQSDRYYGLGDKTGGLNLSGRRLRVAMADALGYDPQSGDPLYKAWPFLVVRDGATGCWYGLLYDNLAEGAFDLGCEHSNYYGLYRYYEARDGDLDYYFIAGPTLPAVLARFSALTGHMALGPRWSLGYAATAMPLADAPDAQARIEAFLREAADRSIPISAFHFGSGYTSIGKRRYVFHWNTRKFPDPGGLTARAAAAGLRLVANVKPCLLDDHPLFDEAAATGALLLDGSNGTPSMAPFWDGNGAHVDFTAAAGVAWWQAGLRKALFSNGIAGVWNDNNEYELWDEGAACACTSGGEDGGHGPLRLALVRPLQALLMARASHEAQAAAAPEERPYTITRAGCPGVQRYAQTWSGDNTTSWGHLRYNLRTGLQMGLSGIANIGHDVGGFAGPPPSGELLLRWLQAGCLHPRFVTNSWKACGTVTSPWTYQEFTPAARWAVRLRYRLMPYLYSCYVTSALTGAPVVRSLFFDFPEDLACYDDLAADQFMVGPALMAAPVVQEGAREVQVYLPKGPPGWYDFYSEQYHEAGATITAAAPLERIPLFVPAGAVLPMTSEARCYSRLHDEPSRCLRVFPPRPAVTDAAAPSDSSIGGGDGGPREGPPGTAGFTMFEDDGLSPAPHAALAAARRAAVSAAAADGGYWMAPPQLAELVLPGGAALRFDLTAAPGEVGVTVAVAGGYKLPYDVMTIALPAADGRRLVLEAVRVDGGSGGEDEGNAAGTAGSASRLQVPRLEAGSFEMHDVIWP